MKCGLCEKELPEIEGLKYCPYCGTDKNYVRPYYEVVGAKIQFLLDGEWHGATVIDGYRTHDGVINVQLDDGRIAWCGIGRHAEFTRQA